ncbi:MAG TPA: glycosyltransferase family 2 protein [Acidimicrobiia bacterium]|jgi:glycosyltransferase involved in cell wall biosynthesis|nr:glycosyltransferase family 2 protein [Acidimicrobiia bacterium]
MSVRATRPPVTAIIPTHNRRTTLQATLTSVLDQRDVDLQVIVIDDGSIDDTGEWLAAVGDPRVRVLRHDVPQGAAKSRTAGVAAAVTEWVAFCDDDDLWSPRKLAAQLDAVAASPGAGWSCTGAVSFVADGSAPVEIVHHQPAPATDGVLAGLLTSNIVPGGGSSVLVGKDLVQEVGGFRGGLAEDWDLWIRLALAAPLATVAAPCTGYRIWRGTGRSRSSDVRGMAAANRTVRERYRSEAETLGVPQVGQADEVYLAKIALRADLRIESSVRYARLARHAPAKLLWAVAALVSPAAVDRATDRRSANAVPAEPRDAALEWLVPLLTEPALTTSGPRHAA